MKLARKPGSTSEIWQVFIRDSSSTTGAGLTGLTNASSGLTAYYHRDTDTTATAISLVSMTLGTFTSGGFKEIDSTNMPGWYQFCPPNAAITTGAKSCGFHLKGATNMAPLPIEVDLDAQVDIWGVNGTAVSVGSSVDANVVSYAAGQAPLQPTVSGRTLDVTATGAAGIDWGNVENPTTVNNLSSTDINNCNSAGTVDSIGAAGITAGVIDTGAIDANAFSQAAADKIWASVARTLTAGTNIVLAKGTGVTGFNDLSAAQVNAEVVDVLDTDTITELATDPGTNPTIQKAIMLLYMAIRNQVTVTASSKAFHNNAGTQVFAKALSDDGTTYSEAKLT